MGSFFEKESFSKIMDKHLQLLFGGKEIETNEKGLRWGANRKEGSDHFSVGGGECYKIC